MPATTCRGCNGQGYIEVPLPPAVPPYTPPAPLGAPAPQGQNDALKAQLIAAGELQPSHTDVEGELQEDEFDRAVDAGVTEEQG